MLSVTPFNNEGDKGVEAREKCRAECTEGEERWMRRLRGEEYTGEERKEGLKERVRRLRCRVR